MKKALFCLISLFFVLSLVTCNWEVPKRVTVTANPDYTIRLGSPFTEGNRLADHLNDEMFLEMMGNSADIEVGILRLPGNKGGVLTYLVHFPILRASLELSRLLEEALASEYSTIEYEVPSELYVVNFTPATYYLTMTYPYYSLTPPGSPTYAISLEEIADLIVEIEFKEGGLGVEIPYSNAFAGHLQIKIPAFGIDDYKLGQVVYAEVNGITERRLRFATNEAFTFQPSNLNDKKLEIFVRIIGPLTESIYPGDKIGITKLIFDWEWATINVSGLGVDDDLNGQFPIDFDLSEFLGEFRFPADSVLAYIYVGGFSEGTTKDAEMLLSAGGTILTRTPGGAAGPASLTPRSRFDLSSITPLQGLPDPSTGSPIDLSGLLNQREPFDLEYEVTIDQVTIFRSDLDNIEISVDLVILLPLALEIETPSRETAFVLLEIEELEEFFRDEDLFRRNEGAGDAIDLDGISFLIKYAEITLENFRTNIIDIRRLKVLLITGDGPNDIYEFNFRHPHPSLRLDRNALANPFIPRIEMLYMKDHGKHYATLQLLDWGTGEPELDFDLVVRANLGIEITMGGEE